MPTRRNRIVLTWIVVFGSAAVWLVVYGGFVRLTRSGLSIVNWDPFMGIIPPLTQQAWQAEFTMYQQTPEYRLINFDMTIQGYKEIFIIEWFHRLFARIAGMIFAIPFFFFSLRKILSPKEVRFYGVIGVLFLAQAVLGWIMVSSGLRDRPAVSHFLLTGHLFLALALIGLSLWAAMEEWYGPLEKKIQSPWSATMWAGVAILGILLTQLAYGGLTAGLKAGYVSDSWPLMLGRVIPPGLMSQVEPVYLNFVSSPLTVAFVHRWLAFGLLAAVVITYLLVHQDNLGKDKRGKELRGIAGLLVGLTILQIFVGIALVFSRVQIYIALFHQFTAICLFAMNIFFLHRLRAINLRDVPMAQLQT